MLSKALNILGKYGTYPLKHVASDVRVYHMLEHKELCVLLTAYLEMYLFHVIHITKSQPD
jgi:hypothetical protein